jgi:hypothetical protein
LKSELSRLVRRTTFGLVALGAIATEIAAEEMRPVVVSSFIALAWMTVALLLGLVVKPIRTAMDKPPKTVFLLLLALTIAPFLVEPIRRVLAGTGYPQELIMLFGLRNLSLGLAAFAVWPLCLRSACIVSLFLMLSSICTTGHPAVLWLLGLYCATGSIWLMLVNWSRLGVALVVKGSATVSVETTRIRLGWLGASLAVFVIGSMLLVVAFGPQDRLRALGEWLSTSGGTGDYDPFSRGGVNDGDEETRGKNALSTGMVETDQFLDSPLPSLYDVANDMYGEPFKPKEQERAIALTIRQKTAESKEPPPDNKRPSREFPTARRGPTQLRNPSERSARALFEVQGRTPLHIRAIAFDTYEGGNWREAALNPKVCMLQKEESTCWMQMDHPHPEPYFAAAELHKFKIAEEIGALIPTPPYPVRFRVGRIDQANFFAWGPERILRFAERKTPSGITIETESRVFDPRLLDGVSYHPGQSPTDQKFLKLPSGLRPEIVALAQEWGGSLPRGREQIAAVIDHLRSDFELDRDAHTSAANVDPLAEFLLSTRRAPDYQFATAAAVLLRVLGYPTRMVSGFYASPDNFDAETKYTPVVREDLHFWTEVLLPDGNWIVIEATPGYQVLGPGITWIERISAGFARLGHWLWMHRLAVALGLVLLVTLWWRRVQLMDEVLGLAIRVFPGASWQHRIGRLLWLTERRAAWSGKPRPVGWTPARWLDSFPQDVTAELSRLGKMAEWVSYGQGLTPPWTPSDLEQIRQTILQNWTLRRFRRLVAFTAVSGELSDQAC